MSPFRGLAKMVSGRTFKNEVSQAVKLWYLKNIPESTNIGSETKLISPLPLWVFCARHEIRTAMPENAL